MPVTYIDNQGDGGVLFWEAVAEVECRLTPRAIITVQRTEAYGPGGEPPTEVDPEPPGEGPSDET